MILRDYQERIKTVAASTIRAHGIFYLSMECRTGKTLTALATAQEYGARHVLFVTKKKAMPSVQNDYALLSPSFDIVVTNYESIHKVNVSFDFAIIDEAHSLGAFPKPSKRQMALRAIVHAIPVLLCSGTPSPEGYSQLYHQFQLSDNSPWRSFQTFYKWSKEYVKVRQRMINGRLLNDYSNAIEWKVKRDITPLMATYTQEQAGFVADIEEHDVIVPMSSVMKEIVESLKHDRIVETDKGVIIGDTPANLLNKLHQVSGGTFINAENQRIVFDTSKALAIREMFSGQKIAIFFCYQAEGDMLRAIFKDNTDVPEEFQTSSSKIFISQVRRAREGVRLDTADALVFYSCEFSYLSYEQARQRLMSKERSKAARVFYMIGDGGIDGHVLNAVRSKQDFTLSYYGKVSK